MSIAGRLEVLLDLYSTTIKTGRRGRPKRLLTKKEVKKLLKELGNEKKI